MASDRWGRSWLCCGHGCAHHKFGWWDGIRVQAVNGHATVAEGADYAVWARPERPRLREKLCKHRFVNLLACVVITPSLDCVIECFVPVLEDLVEWLVDSGRVRRGEEHNPLVVATPLENSERESASMSISHP